MKFVRWGDAGRERPGVLDGDGVIRDLSSVVPDISGATLERLRGLSDIERFPKLPGQPRIGPCVSGVGKFICIGLNYADYAAEWATVPERADRILQGHIGHRGSER